jgi:Kef-type K+ transport system membrane component KefB
VIVVPTAHYLLPRLGRAVVAARALEVEFSFLVLTGLVFAVLAEALSMHFLVGPFVAGLFFVRHTIDSTTYDDVFRKVSALTHGFFAPVFFASIGIHMSAKAFVETPLFLLALIAIASFGKIAGAGLPAWLSGLDRRAALAVGVGMNARGAVELIVADVALAAGLFSQPEPVPPIVASMYSAVVITAIATTFLTPIGLKALLGSAQERDEDGEARAGAT